MQLVVPSAVSAAVNAAIAMRITTSQKFFFIRFYLLILNSQFLIRKVASLKIIEKLNQKIAKKIISGRRPYNFLVNFFIILRPLGRPSLNS